MGDVPFFWPWPTWAKLGFVLGGCLILVLLIASLFKVRSMFRIKRLLGRKTADVERAEIRQSARFLDEIPFGDKAMIQEAEVEGLWNSRASTPLQSPALRPRSSSPSRMSINMFSKSRRNSSVSSLTNLTLPETTKLPHSPSDADYSSSTAIGTIFTADAAHPRRRSVTIRAMSTQDLSLKSAKQGMTSTCPSSSVQTRKARVSTDPGTATPTHEHRGRTIVIGGFSKDSPSLERTPTTKKALARMEAHRNFHAAESGQLQPRLRSLGENPSRHKHTNSDNIIIGHEAARAVSWPITPGEALINVKAPHKVQTMESPPVVPLRAYIETQPPSKTPPSAWNYRLQGMLDEKLEAQGTNRRLTIRNEDVKDHPKGSVIISNKKGIKSDEETVSLLGTQQRKVNSGFEILPAGTLRDERCSVELEDLKKPLQEASNDTGKTRKLQKRSRSSSHERRISLETIRKIIT